MDWPLHLIVQLLQVHADSQLSVRLGHDNKWVAPLSRSVAHGLPNTFGNVVVDHLLDFVPPGIWYRTGPMDGEGNCILLQLDPHGRPRHGPQLLTGVEDIGELFQELSTDLGHLLLGRVGRKFDCCCSLLQWHWSGEVGRDNAQPLTRLPGEVELLDPVAERDFLRGLSPLQPQVDLQRTHRPQVRPINANYCPPGVPFQLVRLDVQVLK